MTILLGVIVVLGELVRIGTRSAAAARDLSHAQLLCESLLAEASASPMPPEPVSLAPLGPEYPDADGWLYSVEVEPLAQPGLVSVRVTVSQDTPAAERPIEYELVRWMADPSYVPASQDPSAVAEESP